MIVLVTGVVGQLGYDVVRELNKRLASLERGRRSALLAKGFDQVIGVDKADFDITSWDETLAFTQKVQPTAIIHCAGYTAVDAAEDNVELCRKINVEGTANIAKACCLLRAKMIDISTDYVFPGTGGQPYEVNTAVGPCNVYGQSKLDGEIAIKRFIDSYFIVRTSWVFGHHGKNFVETMLKLGREKQELNVVNDQIGSPTFTEDLAVLLADIVMTEKYGTYHATNEGFCSWAEFAQEIMKLAGLSCKINPVPSLQYPTRALRPLNSRLSKKSLDEAGFKRLPEWRAALRKYFRQGRIFVNKTQCGNSLDCCCDKIVKAEEVKYES